MQQVWLKFAFGERLLDAAVNVYLLFHYDIPLKKDIVLDVNKIEFLF